MAVLLNVLYHYVEWKILNDYVLIMHNRNTCLFNVNAFIFVILQVLIDGYDMHYQGVEIEIGLSKYIHIIEQ